MDIGAFRTYPEGYKPPTTGKPEDYQSIPLSKIEDFGVHANAYYPLEVQIFKSSLDDHLLHLLWNKYWVNTLSQSPLISVSGGRTVLRNELSHLVIESSLRRFAITRSPREAGQGNIRDSEHSSNPSKCQRRCKGIHRQEHKGKGGR